MTRPACAPIRHLEAVVRFLLFLGGTVVVSSDLNPAGILQVIERHRVTVGFGNPDLLDGAMVEICG